MTVTCPAGSSHPSTVHGEGPAAAMKAVLAIKQVCCTTDEAQGAVQKMIKADMDLDALRLFPSDLQDLLLQSCRQKETGSRAQGLNLGLYQLDLALVLCPQ